MRDHFPVLEADDIIQETLVALCGILPGYRYEPDAKGHFRNYLTGILRNKALKALRKERQIAKIARSAAEDAAPADGRANPPEQTERDRSWREALFEIALNRFLADESVAERTKRIFERTALNGESPDSVAESFKMARHAVDQAKSRAMAYLREMVRELESAADG